MPTIRLILRLQKVDKQGKAPIEVVYQVSGQRHCYRTKERLWGEFWDPSNQRAIFLDKKTVKKLLPAIDPHLIPMQKDIDQVNKELDKLKNRIADIETRFVLDSVQFSAEMVVTKLKEMQKPSTKKGEPSNLVFYYIDQYITDHETIREPGSLSVYKALKNHLQAFQKERGVRISFTEIDTAFFRRFQKF
jgi:hypothetical protein